MSKYASLLISVAGTAARRAVKGWPVALAVFLYAGIMYGAVALFGRMGMVGGFILGLVEAACISNYLQLLSHVVDGSKLSLADLKGGFLALIWDVIGVLFILWIASFVVDQLKQAAPDKAAFIVAAYGLLVGVFLNPVPELIYQRQSPGRSLDLILASVRFVQQHWIEWFVPNLILGGALLALALGGLALDPRVWMTTLPSLFSLTGAYMLGASLAGGGRPLWTLPLILALVHYAMVFRGVLFREIQTGGWRARAFRNAWR